MSAGIEYVGVAFEFAKLAWQLVDYCKSVKDAPEELKNFRAEVKIIAEQLARLRKRAFDTSSVDPGRQRLLDFFEKEDDDDDEEAHSASILGAIKSLYKELDKKLHYRDSRWRRSASYLKWPLEKKSTVELLEQVRRLRQGLQSVVDEANTDISLDVYRLVDKQDDQIRQQTELLRRQIAKSDEQLDKFNKFQEDLDYLKEAEERRTKEKWQSDFTQITSWLNPLSFDERQNELLEDAVGTGEWIIDQEEFQVWLKGRPWRLMLSGSPGAGKSVVASFIIDFLRTQRIQSAGKDTVLFLFLRNEHQEKQTVPRLMASLLQQLMVFHWQTDKHIPEKIRQLWSNSSAVSAQPPLKGTFEVLHDLVAELDRVYIVVDGFDETDEDTRHKLLFKFQQLQKTGKASVVITLRQLEDLKDTTKTFICDACKTVGVKVYYLCKAHDPHFHICNDCFPTNQTCLESPHQLREPYEDRYLPVNPPPEVIAEYVRRKIRSAKRDANNTMDFSEEEYDLYRSRMAEKTIARILKKSPDLEREIPDKIAKRADGLFMLARLHWNQIESADSEGDVRDALKSLPKEYTKSYRKTIKRIEGKAPSDSMLAKMALRWVYYAKRPLSLEELRHALAVEKLRERRSVQEDSESNDGSDSDSDPGEDMGLFDKYSVEPGKLISVAAGLLTFPKDGSAVELVHFTAREYFDTCHSQLFENAEQEMSISMLEYLLNDRFSKPSIDDEENDESTQIEHRLQDLPFAAYASQFWGFHARNVQDVARVPQLVGSLLRSPGNLASAVQTSCYAENKNPTNWTVRKGVNALHVASWFGLHKMMQELTREGFGVNDPDKAKFLAPPLWYACRSGSVEAVKMLVSLRANVNWENRRGRTPLMEAAIQDQAHVIDVLVDASKGGIDINFSDAEEMTALVLAAHKGNFKAVRCLLKQEDIDVNLQDRNGYSALAAAVLADSRLSVSAILRHEGVDVNQTDNSSASPLMIAAERAQPKILSLLLEKGAVKGTADTSGRTALLSAVDEGRLELIKKLFPTDGKTTDDTERDNKGQNALHIAARKGWEHVVAWLLNQGMDMDVTNKGQQTPLHLAARNGHGSVVSLLIDRGADKNALDAADSSPADVARDAGYEKIALAISPEGPRGRNNNGEEQRTPAWKLAMQGSLALLSERLSGTDSDIFVPDSEGNTALHLAIDRSHIDCAKLLLERGADIDAENTSKQTPLHTAAGTASPELVKLLLEQEQLPQLDPLDEVGRTPLRIAILRYSQESAVALIEAGASFDRDSGPLRPVYESAIEDGKTFVAKKLLQSGLVELDLYKDSAIAKRADNPAVRELLHSYKSWVQEPSKRAANSTIEGAVMESKSIMQDSRVLTSEPESMLAKKSPNPKQTDSDQRRQPDLSKPAFRPRPLPAE